MIELRWFVVTLAVLSAGAEAMESGAVMSRRTLLRGTRHAATVFSEVSPRDSLRFLGFLPPAAAGQAAFGDTDHDGADELLVNVNDPEIGVGFTVRILEHQPDNIYQETVRWQSFFLPYETCDLDQDGRSEILGQTGSRLDLYESPTTSSHPTEVVWMSPPLSNVLGSSITGDTDRDGRMEIIHSINPGTSRFIIFENKGDNNYEEVYYDVHAAQDDGRKVIADFDRDGLIEIAVCGTNGYLRMSDDVWERAFVDSTGLDNAYGIAGGQDTDGNGLPELFIVGNLWDEKTQTLPRKIYVYEAPCADSYNRVRTLTFHDQHTGGLDNAVVVTNIDNVIYRAPGPGQWNMTVAAIDPSTNGIHTSIYAFDANENGLPEIFWLSSANTFTTSLLMEHPGVLPTDVVVPIEAGVERLVVTPTPSRGHVTITLGPRSAQAAAVSFYDAAGRLAGRYALTARGRAEFSWSAHDLRPGIYFVRAEGTRGALLAKGRAIVVR